MLNEIEVDPGNLSDKNRQLYIELTNKQLEI